MDFVAPLEEHNMVNQNAGAEGQNPGGIWLTSPPADECTWEMPAVEGMFEDYELVFAGVKGLFIGAGAVLLYSPTKVSHIFLNKLSS